MTKLEVYRVKDTVSGKYLSKPKYSYSGISWTKRGRIYSALGHIKISMATVKFRLFEHIRDDLFISKRMERYIRTDTGYTISPEWQAQHYKEREYLKEIIFPDTIIVVNSADEQVCTLQELLTQHAK